MKTTLKQTLRTLLYGSTLMMILVAGSANWPRH
jgi:hypothetical protein